MAKQRKPRGRGAKSPQQPYESDADLWQAFVQNIERSAAKQRVPDREIITPQAPLSAPSAKSTEHQTAGKSRKNAQAKRQATSGTAPIGPAQPQKPRPTAIDAKNMRRIGKGRTAIDARIDLHGLRQNEAHTALRVFLHRSAAKGHRLVLVITGKGSPSVATDDDASFGSYVHEGGIGRGVLRRSVPIWLSEADLRSVVVSYTTAHIRHGGEGALYVQLRRKRT